MPHYADRSLTVTKTELDDHIAKTTAKAVKAAMKKAKKKAKARKRGGANNGGDITAADLKHGVTGSRAAGDVRIPGTGPGSTQPVTKDLARLAKAAERETDPLRKAELGQRLTLERLRRAHEAGII